MGTPWASHEAAYYNKDSHQYKTVDASRLPPQVLPAHNHDRIAVSFDTAGDDSSGIVAS